jgi:hypothetical protein
MLSQGVARIVSPSTKFADQSAFSVEQSGCTGAGCWQFIADEKPDES